MSERLKSGFEISLFSDLKYSNMTSLIRYIDDDFAQVIIDENTGDSKIDFMIDGSDADKGTIFLVNDVMEAIQIAMGKIK